jgi:hypothetical protein
VRSARQLTRCWQTQPKVQTPWNNRLNTIDADQILVGPCLKGCGNEAAYQEVDHETEGHRVICPACGTYLVTIRQMEDKGII